MHPRTQDSVLLSTLALAVIVGKLTSAALHEPRHASEFDMLGEPASISAAEPAVETSGAAADQPVQYAPTCPAAVEVNPKPINRDAAPHTAPAS